MSARPQRPGRTTLRNDCCERAAVWDAEGQAVHPDELPISPGLRRQLEEWLLFFDEHLDEDGWDVPSSKEEYARLGRALQRQLQAELREPVHLDVTAYRVGR